MKTQLQRRATQVNRNLFLFIVAGLIGCTPPPIETTHQLSTETLKDKIKGGWAAQTIGVTFGGPTEFQYNGTYIQDYEPIPWYDGYLKWWYDNAPGLYDDIYMDLTFVDVFEREGLDAPASAFADAYANADYMLWHANQMARYNILNGLQPPASGHWRNNPEADDIDFQIEADFAGLMSPGMPNTAAVIADTVGHIMNYGDGWYGGVYVAAMYALAFTSNDVDYVVEEALKVIPEASMFYQTIYDVIQWHKQYPDDWKRTWFEIQKKWSEDRGCAHGVFNAFNIDAKINSAYVVLGLLYGEGDFGKTLSISTRAGQDSDCNPATAGGILGVMLGYDNIPAFWKQGLAEVEPIDFRYTTISLDDVYDMSYRHALEVLRRNGGDVGEAMVTMPVQVPEPVALEESFPGHYPIAEISLSRRLYESTSFTFDGIGFVIAGDAVSVDEEAYTLEVEVYIDDERVETTNLPTQYKTRKFIPFWRYELPDGEHTVRLVVTNPSENTYINLQRAIIYGAKPAEPTY